MSWSHASGLGTLNFGEELSNLIPSLAVAGRVRAGSFADGTLVNQHDIRERQSGLYVFD